MSNTTKALKDFLNIKFPTEEFEDNEIAFLDKYMEQKDGTYSPLLKELNIEKSQKIEKAMKDIQDIKKRFNSIKQRVYEKYNQKSDMPENYDFWGCIIKDSSSFDNVAEDFNSPKRFKEFFEWWVGNLDKKDKYLHCAYCGVSEKVTRDAFKYGYISSKKPAFNKGSIQIDQTKPNQGYNRDNCVFACVLCNNAKSDMISNDEFKKYFAGGIADFWSNLKKRMYKE